MNDGMATDKLSPRDLALLTAALAALEAGTGVTARVLNKSVFSQGAADAVVELSLGRRKQRYFALCKAIVDRESTLALAKHRLDALDGPALLVAPYLSPQMASKCRALDLQFADAAGNAYLNGEGLHVFVSGQRPTAAAAPLTHRGASSPSVMRMVFALLARPALLQASYRDIADAAGIALGSVGAVFAALGERGMLVGSGRSGPRRFTAPGSLVDEWVAAYPAVLRPKLHAQRFEAPDAGWWEHADVAQAQARWSGEVAAFRMHGYLKPATQTLYVAPDAMPRALRRLVSAHRLRPQPAGPVEIVEAFWDFGDGGPTVPPLLAYADLMATMDPRNREAATMIRDHEIQHVLYQF